MWNGISDGGLRKFEKGKHSRVRVLSQTRILYRSEINKSYIFLGKIFITEIVFLVFLKQSFKHFLLSPLGRVDFTSKASKRRERSYLYTNLKKFLSLDDLYRLGFDSLSEPLFPRSAPLLSLRDIFPVSSGEHTPREKARISIKKVTFLSFPDNRCDLFCLFIVSLNLNMYAYKLIIQLFCL